MIKLDLQIKIERRQPAKGPWAATGGSSVADSLALAVPSSALAFTHRSRRPAMPVTPPLEEEAQGRTRIDDGAAIVEVIDHPEAPDAGRESGRDSGGSERANTVREGDMGGNEIEMRAIGRSRRKPELLKLVEEISRVTSKIKSTKKELERKKSERKVHAKEVERLQKEMHDVATAINNLNLEGQGGEKLLLADAQIKEYHMIANACEIVGVRVVFSAVPVSRAASVAVSNAAAVAVPNAAAAVQQRRRRRCSQRCRRPALPPPVCSFHCRSCVFSAAAAAAAAATAAGVNPSCGVALAPSFLYC
ncbi:Structural maintenance of chromosomes protein 1 [Nymphaea thermarum]|nr:Structural maintenance of chromosomes protein 1 [Nymphaea thermarum]